MMNDLVNRQEKMLVFLGDPLARANIDYLRDTAYPLIFDLSKELAAAQAENESLRAQLSALHESHDNWRDAALDFKAQLAAAKLPDGWEAVPIEPTFEMKMAGGEVDDTDLPCDTNAGIVYKAMLSAAPQPEDES